MGRLDRWFDTVFAQRSPMRWIRTAAVAITISFGAARAGAQAVRGCRRSREHPRSRCLRGVVLIGGAQASVSRDEADSESLPGGKHRMPRAASPGLASWQWFYDAPGRRDHLLRANLARQPAHEPRTPRGAIRPAWPQPIGDGVDRVLRRNLRHALEVQSAGVGVRGSRRPRRSR